MKRCPKCSRVYTDDTLNFCLDDGEWLVGETAPDEPRTAILSGERQIRDTSSQQTAGEARQANSERENARADRLRSPNSRRIAVTVAIVLAVVAIIFLVVYKFAGKREVSGSLAARKITRLTSNGKIGSATISPDGKYVAYSAVDESNQASLWVRYIATSSNVQIVPPAGADVSFGQTTFSPDGNYIYFIRTERNVPGALFHVPVLGGPSKKVMENVTRISFSPDGGRFTFQRRDQSQGQDNVMIANLDGSGEQILSVRKHPDYYLPGAAWSPDGQTIACPTGGFEGGYYRSIAFIQVSDGVEKQLPFHRWNNLDRAVWMSDGTGVITTANDKPTDPYQIWLVPYPAGEARPLTNDLSDYRNVSLTSDSTALVAGLTDTSSNLWVAPFAQPNGGQQLTSSKRNGSSGVAWTPDGRIIYDSSESGNNELWSIGADGRDKRQLTDDGNSKGRYPCVTPDGRHIVFDSYRSGSIQLWRTDIDGSNSRLLTSGPGFAGDCSRSDQRVVYTTFGPGGFSIWKVSIDGGDPAQLINKYALIPSVSPDGKLIACYNVDEVTRATKIGIFPIDGGDALKQLDLIQAAGSGSPPVRWLPDGRALAYIATRGGVSNIWLQPIDGDPPKQMTDMKNERIFWFDISRDGKQIALSRGTVTSDVVLIKDFR